VKDFKYLIVLLMLCGQMAAQNDSLLLKNASGKTLKKLGKSALAQGDPASAIVFLEAYIKTSKTDVQAQELLGKAYLGTRDYERAKRAFLRAYTINKDKAPEALYYHAQMQKSVNRYDSAKYNFQKFKKEYKGSNSLLKKQASREIAFCDSVQRILKSLPKLLIQRLDTSINKVHVEAAPTNKSDDELVFTSYRTEKIEYTYEEDTSDVLRRKLFVAKRKNGKWNFVGEFGEGINDDHFHTGNAAFSSDRQRLYFTRCRENSSGEMICAIYVSSLEDGKWSEPSKLPSPINSNKYTSTMPSVGVDPVKGNDLIYFVSDRKGGKGGLDIWYTIFDKKKGIYKAPKNAGSKVNTNQNEITPFYDSETRALYFSSEGLGGLGGYDVFKTLGDGKKWSGTQNLGMPLNSGADDIFYTISTNREEGFFVSNRKGGNALKNKTCCDDIYYYKHLQYIKINLRGNINEMTDGSAPVANANIEIYFRDKLTNEKVLVKTVQSDKDGNYNTSVEPGHDYFLVVKKEDYLGTSGDVTTEGVIDSKELDKDLQLIRRPKAPIHIPNVKYQYDRSDIEEGSKTVLDTTVLKLMVDNPELIIEIMAHTDNKGTDAYNLKLSQRRAESIVKYLVSKGIDAKRLKAKGYGESQPVAPNQNSDGTDNPAGRARNRRTDFKIIGVIDAELINDADKE
jgi:outer membrane protein OmpA-like peptidoglycan-associated protein/tetratricopeptide (TPR) repeat protein